MTLPASPGDPNLAWRRSFSVNADADGQGKLDLRHRPGFMRYTCAREAADGVHTVDPPRANGQITRRDGDPRC
ncbi:MAG: hypothetical protein LBJ08_07630 [Bifidobacteriaceae bacterium]|nr:hypothetical protein [Bifidobacteriaceae bacterium]